VNQIYFEGKFVDLLSDDYQFLQDSIDNEIQKLYRSISSNGTEAIIIKGFILQVDPSDSTKLYISQDGEIGAVSANQIVIESSVDISGIDLSDSSLGTINSVYAKCTPSYASYNPKTEVTTVGVQTAIDYYSYSNVYNRIIDVMSIVVYTAIEYAALTSSEKEELVLLGSVTAQGTGASLSSSNIDLTSVEYFHLNIPEHQIDVGNLVTDFKLPQIMVYNTSTGDINDSLSYPLLTPSDLTDDLNVVRTQIRNIKQTVKWDDFQTGAFASDPDMDILHRTGVAPSAYNSYNDFNYTLSNSGTVITIATGKALIKESKLIELEETSFSIPSSVNSLITAEMHTIGEQTPPPTGVTFTLNVYPLTSSGGISLQVYSSTGELYTKDIDYAIQDAATGVIRIIPGPSGDIVNENIYCTYYASGYRCDVVACSTTDLVYLEGTPTVLVLTNPPAITNSSLLPLFYIYRNPLVDSVTANDIIDARIWLEPVKEVRELTTTDLTSYASSTGGYHPAHTNALSNMAFYLVSGDTLEPIGANWSVTSTGDTPYITMNNTTYMTTYMYTRPSDKIWIIVRPTTSYTSVTLTYETVPGSNTLNGTSSIEVPYVSSVVTTFVPVFFDNLNINDGVTKFKLAITSGASIDFSTILVGDSDLRYLNSLMKDATANLNAYVNRGSISSLNMYVGYDAMTLDSGGVFNTAIGYESIKYGTIGNYNVALGMLALSNCSEGSNNTAIGSDTLAHTVDGYSNTAIGAEALHNNLNGAANTAVGYNSLNSNLSGGSNTAIGYITLEDNTVGLYNVALGRDSLMQNVSGSYNTALGAKSLDGNLYGSSNVAIGYNAGNRCTLSNKLYIDNQDRNTQSGELSGCLIVGTFNSVSANQNVTINGSLNAKNISSENNVTVGQIRWTSAREVPIEACNTSGDVNYGIATLGERYCACLGDYANTNAKLRMLYFNGNSWSSVGAPSGNVFSSGAYTSMTTLNSTDVAMIRANASTGSSALALKSFRFNYATSAWTQVATASVSHAELYGSGITSLTSSTIACAIAGASDSIRLLRTYTVSGTTWSILGNDLLVSGAISQETRALTALNSTDVAFGDMGNHELQTYRFNGSTWTTLGSRLFISGILPYSLTSLNSTDVAMTAGDNGWQCLQIFRFLNSNTWTSVGYPCSHSGYSAARISTLNGTDVVGVGQGGPSSLKIFRFDYQVSNNPYKMW
jgi:hypothetical protein